MVSKKISPLPSIKTFFRIINLKKFNIAVLILPFLISVLIITGSLAIVSNALTNEYLDEIVNPLDILITVDGANSSCLKQIVSEVKELEIPFENLDYYHRSLFFLPLEQKIEPHIIFPDRYNLSANTLASLHFLALPQSIQDQMGLNLNSSEVVLSSSLMKEYDIEKGDEFNLWGVDLSHLIIAGNVSSVVPPMWFNSTVSQVFSSTISDEASYFYSPILFNVTDKTSLEFEYHHLSSEGGSHFIMVSTEFLDEKNWVNNITEYRIAIDLKTNYLRKKTVDLSEYLYNTADQIISKIEEISSKMQLEDITITLNNYLGIKIDTVNEIIMNKFSKTIYDFIPVFALNLFLGYFLQQEVINDQSKVKKMLKQRGVSITQLFAFFSTQMLLSFIMGAGVIIGLFVIAVKISENIVVYPTGFDFIPVTLFLLACHIIVSVEAIRKETYRNKEKSEDVQTDLVDITIKNTEKGTRYLLSLLFLIIGYYFINTFEKLFSILQLDILRFILAIVAVIVSLAIFWDLTEILFIKIINKQGIKKVGEIFKPILKSFEIGTHKYKKIWIAFLLYLVAFGAYCYPKVREGVEYHSEIQDSNIGDGLIIFNEGYDIVKEVTFKEKLRSELGITNTISFFEIDWIIRGHQLKLLYTDTEKLVDFIDIWDKNENEEIKALLTKISEGDEKGLITQKTAELYQIRKGESLYVYNERTVGKEKIFFSKLYEVEGIVKKGIPTLINLEGMFDISSIPEIPQQLIKLKTMSIKFELSGEEDTFVKWLKKEYPDLDFIERYEGDNSDRQYREILIKINTNFLFLAGIALSLGCIIISWSQLSKTREITKKFQKILQDRGYSKQLYKQERKKYNLSLISYQWFIGIIKIGEVKDEEINLG